MVHSTTLHLLYLYYSTINICTINGTSGTTHNIDRSSNSHFLVNIYYTFIQNVPTLLASHDSSPICWRTVGTVPNVAYVPPTSTRVLTVYSTVKQYLRYAVPRVRHRVQIMENGSIFMDPPVYRPTQKAVGWTQTRLPACLGSPTA